MTKEKIQSLNLPLTIDDETMLYIEACIEWLNQHTSLDIENMAAIPANVKLFIVKYVDIIRMSSGVSSESIEGLSQSFKDVDLEDLIYQAAHATIDEFITSGKARFVEM